MKVLLDLDGVLVDFVGAICMAHGKPNPYEAGDYHDYAVEARLGLSPDAFWQPANRLDFWANLPWMPDGRALLNTVLEFVPADDVCLLTSPTLSPLSAAGKLAWIQREVPGFSRRFLIGPAKNFCAHHDAVLIDDSDANVRAFCAAGGQAILVPRPWNVNHALGIPAPRFMRRVLQTMTGASA